MDRTTVLRLTVVAAALAGSAGAVAPQSPEPVPILAGRAPGPGTYAPGMDVVHYDLELGLDSGSDRFDARARIRVRLVGSVPEALVFDLSGLAVHTAAVDGTEAPFQLDAGRIWVTLPAGHAVGDEVEAVIAYGGVPDDGLVLRDNVHGAPAAFADNWPNRARFWFPSVDHPSDKAKVSFTVHAPQAWTVVANGWLQGEPQPAAQGALGGHEGKRTWRWRSDVDIPSYTMVVGAAELDVRSVGLAACGKAPASHREDGCVDVTYWVFPQDVVKAAPSFDRAPGMVDFFAETIGPFPYEKMANVQSATRFGGMENASAIFYSEQAIASGRNIEGTVSHEIAHQWFGDSVTEAEWHHLWLSEGFATYFGNLFFEFADGVEVMRDLMEDDRTQYLESGQGAGPVIDESEQDLFALLNRNNYQKGGWVLHMLRNVMGDDDFFQGIRAYYTEHAHATAVTEDLRRHMEAASGQDLEWFFEQWLYRPGHPVLAVDWSPRSGGGVSVTVEQVQPSEWPTFRFPLTVELVDAQGEHRRERFQIDDRSHTFQVQAPAPETLWVDPDGVLLKELRP